MRNEGQYKRNGTDLRGANLNNVDLRRLPLARIRGGLTWDEWIPATHEQREMAGTLLKEANLSRAHLEGAFLNNASMEKANCSWAYLDEANLRDAHLEGAHFFRAHLEGAQLSGAHLEGCNLVGAFFDTGTRLNDVHLGNEEFGYSLLADVHWGDVNLSVIDWAQVKVLGDEQKTYQLRWKRGKKTRQERADKRRQLIKDYKAAVRANRQLAATLRNQGMNEEASNFSRRAQILQRKVLWQTACQQETQLWRRVMRLGNYVFSLLLDILAGYGYKPQRSFAAYLFVIACFTTAYYVLGQTIGPYLSPLRALVFSVTAFHGRGFFPGGIRLDDPITVLAALEAVVGLTIEVSLIATFTQRFFAR